MSSGLFITGTDTGVGKTCIAAAMLTGAAARGLVARGMKPVASGARQVAGVLRNEDAELLWQAGSDSPDYADVNPYVFEPAVAPHIAAALAGRVITLDPVRESFGRLARGADLVVVEGVGGWQVPLAANLTTADMAIALGLPVLLVVGMRLGCLNHALLTVQAVNGSGLPLLGWVANRIDPAMAVFEENRQALEERIGAPCLGTIPQLESADPAALAALPEMQTIIDTTIKILGLRC